MHRLRYPGGIGNVSASFEVPGGIGNASASSKVPGGIGNASASSKVLGGIGKSKSTGLSGDIGVGSPESAASLSTGEEGRIFWW